MAEVFNLGDIVQVIYSPGLLDREAGFMKYLGMAGIIVASGINPDCWIVQFEEFTEVEIPAACLAKE